MKAHDHVTLDESVFHAYQDIACEAALVAGGKTSLSSLRWHLATLDRRLDRHEAEQASHPDHEKTTP